MKNLAFGLLLVIIAGGQLYGKGRISHDTILVHFQGWFEKENIKIYSKEKIIFDSVISTDEVTGLAKIISINKQSDLFVVIKNKRIRLYFNKEMFCIVRLLKGKKISITYTNKEPIYK